MFPSAICLTNAFIAFPSSQLLQPRQQQQSAVFAGHRCDACLLDCIYDIVLDHPTYALVWGCPTPLV